MSSGGWSDVVKKKPAKGSGSGGGSQQRPQSQSSSRSDSQHSYGRGSGRSGSGRGSYGGRGGGGGNSGGRGGGRGGGGRSQQNPTSAISNVIPATVTPNFSFYMYSIDGSDKKGNPIASKRRRIELLNIGLFDKEFGLLARNGYDSKLIADFKRIVFCEGSFFFSARRIPFLESLPLEIVGAKERDSKGNGTPLPVMDNGDAMSIQKLDVYSAPTHIATTQAKNTEQVAMLVDRRCSMCTSAFADRQSLINHCSTTGHKPVCDDDEVDSEPAPDEVFISYCNIALNRAMSERMAKWGKEFIDPKEFTEPKDRNGKSYGVNIFRAYSCDFGLTKINGNTTLALTCDLKAKIIRKRSLLENIYDGANPEKTTLDRRKKQDFKRSYEGEVVICTYDKRCYSVIEIDFDHSPATLPVEGLGMSHADYFAQRKKIKLQYPNATPIIAVLGRNNCKIYLPAEFVCINELDIFVKQQLPRIASFDPPTRHVAIDEIKRFLVPGAQKTKGVGGGFLPAIGITIKNERIKVGVEVLSLPKMIVAGMDIPTDRLNWDPVIKKANYKVESNLVNLKVVLIHNEKLQQNRIKYVYDTVCKMVNQYKSAYRFPNSPTFVVKAGDKQKHWGAVEKHFSSKQPSNVFVLDLSKPPARQAHDPAYSVVKHLLSKSGYLSQFINFNTCNHGEEERRSIPILAGVARQILGKCGVRIWWVQIPREIPMPAVFVGVDVFHAPRKYESKEGKRVSTKKSVAAIVVQVVRSHNERENRSADIYSETFERDAGQEYELGSAMHQTVANALKVLRVNPMSCIVWRDGVGAPAINTVASQEIPAVRQALANVSSPSTTVGMSTTKPSVARNIPLSYIVVQKRISTKFLSTDGAQNIPPGSLIVGLQGTEHDTFYINGTSPPNSTSKPARFIIANTDKGFTAPNKTRKLMADVSWALCNNYSNWPGPIKLPSPVQYAHKLAELAGGFEDYGNSIDDTAFAGKIYFL